MSNPLLEQFLSEAQELLQGIGVQLMTLERTPDDAESMTALFRMVHTLKGNSGLFEVREMTRVLHAAEDLMDSVRHGRQPFAQGTADRLLEAMDFVAQLCEELEQSGSVSASHAVRSSALADALRAMVAGSDSSPGAHGTAATSAAAAPAVPMHEIPAALRAEAARRVGAGQDVHWVEYVPDEECFFQGEDPLFQARGSLDTLWCRILARTPWPALDALDAYRCNLTFQLLSTAPREFLDEHFRYMAEHVRIVALTVPMLQQPEADMRRELVIRQRTILESAAGDATNLPGRIRAAAAGLAPCLTATGRAAAEPALQAAVDAALAAGDVTPLVAWISATFPETVQPSASPDATDTSVAGIDPRAGRRSEDTPPPSRSLKVDQAKIDRLMNLIGEIIVAKNALPYLATRAESVFGNRELAREIKAQHAVINRISEEMQDAIMQVRMLPVSFVFQRFPRLVRDTARALDKDVSLVLEGEETEADKNVIESIADPLIHIVRNSLDHGFESPDERVASGKPAAGTLVIRARQESDRVLIEVVDDGKGIDPVVIRRKALEKGVADAATLERMSDAAAVNLVFAAGFSTRDVVSDLSGRGVGMDVVRTEVEKIGGTVSLESTVGVGTRMRLSLPLSMAVTNVMMIESDGQVFGVPMDSVLETVRVPRDDIRVIKTTMTTSLRGSVVPLRSVNSMLAIASPPRTNDHDEYAALVVRAGQESVGLLVDEFRGTTDVILKPMAGVLAGLGTYAGSALMGDGSVLMILDVNGML